jgi:hypothetical protein
LRKIAQFEHRCRPVRTVPFTSESQTATLESSAKDDEVKAANAPKQVKSGTTAKDDDMIKKAKEEPKAVENPSTNRSDIEPKGEEAPLFTLSNTPGKKAPAKKRMPMRKRRGAGKRPAGSVVEPQGGHIIASVS